MRPACSRGPLIAHQSTGSGTRSFFSIEHAEVAHQAQAERAVPQHKANLKIAIQRRFREVRRGDEDGLVIDHDSFSVQDTARPVQLKGSWVVQDRWP